MQSLVGEGGHCWLSRADNTLVIQADRGSLVSIIVGSVRAILEEGGSIVNSDCNARVDNSRIYFYFDNYVVKFDRWDMYEYIKK